MKVKVAEATRIQIDWMVAMAEGYDCLFDDDVSGPWLVPQEGYLHDEKPLESFRPSAIWSQGGPIIERHVSGLMDEGDDEPRGQWSAMCNGTEGFGPTLLIAAMRCYVASKLGDEVEVPEELI